MIKRGLTSVARHLGPRETSQSLSQGWCKRQMVTVGQSRTRRTQGRVGVLGEGRVPPQATNDQNSLTVLWNTIVRGIYFSQVDAIPGTDQRLEQIKHKTTTSLSQKPFDVLKDKSQRLVAFDQQCKCANEVIPAVFHPAPPGGGEALAWRTTNDHRRSGKLGAVTQVSRESRMPKVLTVRLNGRLPVIVGCHDLEAGPLKPQRESSAA